MAKRNDLMGLAALGALGYILNYEKQDGKGVPVENRFGVQTPEYQEPMRGNLDMMKQMGPKKSEPETKAAEKIQSKLAPKQKFPEPARGNLKRMTQMGPKISADDGVRGNLELMRQMGPNVYLPAGPETSTPSDRKSNYGMLQSIRDYYASPTTEGSVSRNIKNTLNALTPMGGGAGSAAIEGAMLPRAQRLYNEAAAARRGREAVENPLLWAQGSKAMAQEQKAIDAARRINKPLSELDTTGGAIGYKKGGATKAKKAPAPVKSSASRRGDGIAMRGKTRGKMV